jgi:hypothetical protein
MKKITLLAALFLSILTAQAQDSDTGLEIGLKVSPAIASNRVNLSGANNFKGSESMFRGSFGLVLDYFFGKNYALSTGLEYGVKGGKVSYGSVTKTEDELNIQYIQLPIGLKLFTNDVASDTRIYFQLGTSLNCRISSKINGSGFYLNGNNEDIKANKRYNFFDADVVLGTGAEWQLGTNTKLFGGLSYHRGLIDVDRYYDKYVDKNIEIRNNFYALDLGLKF